MTEIRWDAFISYSRNDSAFANRLVKGLEARGHSVWIDTEDIPPAQLWREELRRAISSSHGFIFAISPASYKSIHCMHELEFACEQHKRLFPVLWRRVEIAALPHDSPLSETQWLDFTSVGEDLPDGEIEPLLEQLATALRDEYNWRRQGTDYLVRAEAWRGRGGPHLHRTELDAARDWLRSGVRTQPGPSELQIDYIQASQAYHLEIAQHWQTLYRKTKARQLAAQARQHVYDMPDLALLLSAEAQKTQDLPETRRALLHCLDVHRRLVATLHELKAGEIMALAVSPDRRRLAATDAEALMVWDLETLSPFRRINVSFNALTFGANADELIIARQHDIKFAGIGLGNLKGRDLAGHKAWVRALAYDPVSYCLASGDDTGRIFIWELTTQDRIELQSDRRPIHRISWMPDGKSLLCCEGTMLRVRPLVGPDQVTVELEFEGDVVAADVSPNGRWIAAAGHLQGRERVICLDTSNWQWHAIPNPERQWLFRDLRFIAEDLLVTAGGGVRSAYRFWFIAGCSGKGVISNLPRAPENAATWHVEGGLQPDPLLSSSRYQLGVLARSFDGEWLAGGGAERKVFLWAPRLLSCLPSQTYQTERPVVLVASSLHHDELAAVHADGTVTLLSTESNGPPMRTFATGQPSIRRLIHGGDRLLGLREDGSVAIWTAEGGREEASAPSGHEGECMGLTWSPKRRFVATCGADGTVLLLDGARLNQIIRLEDESPTAYQSPLHSPEEEPGPPRRWPFSCVLFSPDETRVYASTTGGRVLAWDTSSGEQQSLGIDGENPLNDMALSQDGSCLVGVTQNELLVWDLTQPTRHPEKRSGHVASIRKAVFHPDGRSFVSMGDDGLLLWLVDEYEFLGRISVASGSGPIAFTHDGRLLVQADGKGAVVAWNVSPEGWIEYAQCKAQRSFSTDERNSYLDAEAEPGLPD